MAVSTVYPNSFVCNSSNVFDTSVNAKPRFLQPSAVTKTPENPMTKPPKNGEFFNSSKCNLAKEVEYEYKKYKSEYSMQLEGMEGSESVYGTKTIHSSALMNEEIGILSPQKNLKVVSNSVKDARKNVNRKDRLSLGSIPKYVKCFCCERIIKEDHFCEHLLFGSVKCSDCNEAISDCQSFQIWTTELSLGVVSCEHSLSYCEDPAEYLSKKLSGNMFDDVNDIAKAPTFFENYINKLDSLTEQKPWKEAIEACRVYMLNRKSPLSQSSNPKSQQKTRESYFKKICTSKDKLSRDKQTGLIKTSETTLSSTSSQKSAVKHNSFKQNDKFENDMHDSRTSRVTQSNDLEFVEVPKNGFYYVNPKPVDECPNCYTFLSPCWATVNVNSFLITVICVSCNLTIYITSPKVEIVTDKNSVLHSLQKSCKLKKKCKKKSLAPQTYMKK